MKKQNILKIIKYSTIYTLGYISVFPIISLIFDLLSENNKELGHTMLYLTIKAYEYFRFPSPDKIFDIISFFSSCFLSLVTVIIGGWFIRYLLKKNDTEKQFLTKIKENIAIFILGYISIFPLFLLNFIFLNKKSEIFYYIMLSFTKIIENLFVNKTQLQVLCLTTLFLSYFLSAILTIIFRKLFRKLYNKKQI